MEKQITQSDSSLAQYIDHTILKPNLTRQQFEQACHEAKQFGFFSVCIPPSLVASAKDLLNGSKVKVCTVIGFPLGYNSSVTKSSEASQAIIDGADELDMVINIHHAKNGDFQAVQKDIEAVVKNAQGRLVKVILETSLLSDEEIVCCCQASVKAGADFVKTSTGFSTGGATVDAIKLMRKSVGPDLGVKASGGIRNIDQARAMIQAGANRLGCSAGVKIVSGDSPVSEEGY